MLKHILMGSRFILGFICIVVCFSVLVLSIGLIAVSCGVYVAIGVCVALVLFAAGFIQSID